MPSSNSKETNNGQILGLHSWSQEAGLVWDLFQYINQSQQIKLNSISLLHNAICIEESPIGTKPGLPWKLNY